MKLSEYINSFTKDDKYRLSSWKDRLEKARPFLFDFDYPVYNNNDFVMSPEEIKKEFEMGFMRYYYKRTLGTSGGTITDFKHDLEELLVRKMPYFNEEFYSLSFKYDLTDNTNIKETFTREVDDILNEGVERNDIATSKRKSINDTTLDIDGNENSKETQDENSTNNFRGIELDTPQGSQNIDDMNFKHASGGSITKDTDVSDMQKEISSNTKQNQKGYNSLDDDVNTTAKMNNDKNQTKKKTETYTQERKGKIGVNTYPKMIADYRKNIINVIEEMILECDILFYQLYD